MVISKSKASLKNMIYPSNFLHRYIFFLLSKPLNFLNK